MLSHAEATQLISEEEALQNLLDLLQWNGFTVTSWVEGDPVLTILRAIANRDAQLAAMISYYRDNRYNATATSRQFMADIAKSDYGNEFFPAVAEVHPITLTLQSTEPDTLIALGGLVVATRNGLTFRNIETGTVTSGGTLVLNCQAEVAGATGGIGIGEISEMVTTFAGVTCSNNSAAVVDGVDDESVDAIRVRNVQKWPALSLENTVDGIAAVAKAAAPSITSVAVDDENPIGPGSAIVYCAVADGPPGPLVIAAARDAIWARFFNPEARIGVTACGTTQWNPSGLILCNATIGTAQTQANVEIALASILADLPIGGRSYVGGDQHVLLRDDVVARVRSTAGVIGFSLNGTGNYSVGIWSKLLKPSAYNFNYVLSSVS
jgi:hypothetical protein